MVSPHTALFAARGVANTIAREYGPNILDVLSGHGFDVMSELKKQLAFQSPANSKEYQVTGDVLLAALDYALGRQSAAVSQVADDIRKHWSDLHEDCRASIKFRIKDAIEKGSYGMNMDRREWETILALDDAPQPGMR